MVIQNHITSIRQTRAMDCTFFPVVIAQRARVIDPFSDQGLKVIDHRSTLQDHFNCSWYVLVNHREKCDDNQITDKQKTSPLITNPVSEDINKGGYDE